MKSKKKVLVTLLCAVLLVFASVMGTMAYLTSDDEVVNTFTVGDVVITLDEADVDADGKAIADADRVDANEYKLLPGHLYDKDPIVHVDAASEECWIYVKVVNEIADIEDANATVAAQMAENGWVVIDEANGIWAYETTVNGGDNVAVFETFKIAGTVDNDTLADYDGLTITVTAYAIQADGFGTSGAAWDAAKGQFTL